MNHDKRRHSGGRAQHRFITNSAHTLLFATPEVSMDLETPIWADDSDDLVPGPLDEEDDADEDEDDEDDDDDDEFDEDEDESEDEEDESAADEEADNG